MPKKVCLPAADIALDSSHVLPARVIGTRSESVNVVLCPTRYVWSVELKISDLLCVWAPMSVPYVGLYKWRNTPLTTLDIIAILITVFPTLPTSIDIMQFTLLLTIVTFHMVMAYPGHVNTVTTVPTLPRHVVY